MCITQSSQLTTCKIGDADKKTILQVVKETTDWIDENGQNASAEDLEEKLAGASQSDSMDKH